MTECQNDLKPKEKDGLETAEIVRLVPLEGSEVGHSIVKHNGPNGRYLTASCIVKKRLS
jgi:hypothetical protein